MGERKENCKLDISVILIQKKIPLRKFERKFLETSNDDYLADFENK